MEPLLDSSSGGKSPIFSNFIQVIYNESMDTVKIMNPPSLTNCFRRYKDKTKGERKFQIAKSRTASNLKTAATKNTTAVTVASLSKKVFEKDTNLDDEHNRKPTRASVNKSINDNDFLNAGRDSRTTEKADGKHKSKRTIALSSDDEHNRKPTRESVNKPINDEIFSGQDNSETRMTTITRKEDVDHKRNEGITTTISINKSINKSINDLLNEGDEVSRTTEEAHGKHKDKMTMTFKNQPLKNQ